MSDPVYMIIALYKASDEKYLRIYTTFYGPLKFFHAQEDAKYFTKLSDCELEFNRLTGLDLTHFVLSEKDITSIEGEFAIYEQPFITDKTGWGFGEGKYLTRKPFTTKSIVEK